MEDNKPVNIFFKTNKSKDETFKGSTPFDRYIILQNETLHEENKQLISKVNEVPFIGNIMVSRWAYEALIVAQAKDNEFQKKTYKYQSEASQSAWKRDFWIPEIKNKLEIISSKKTKAKDFKN